MSIFQLERMKLLCFILDHPFLSEVCVEVRRTNNYSFPILERIRFENHTNAFFFFSFSFSFFFFWFLWHLRKVLVSLVCILYFNFDRYNAQFLPLRFFLMVQWRNPSVHLPVSEYSQMKLHEICATKVAVSRSKIRRIFSQNNVSPNLINCVGLMPCIMSFVLYLSHNSISKRNHLLP